MFQVSVTGHFAAAHQLRLADGTPEPPHGHRWRVTATFGGPQLDDRGVLLDFTSVKRQLDKLLATLHERNLHDLAAFATRNPSAENVALHIAEQLGQNLPAGVRLQSVEVEEEPGCVARYRLEDGDNVTT